MDNDANRAVAVAMADVMEGFGPVWDAADGVRADLVRRGWSQAIAESLAASWVQGAIATFWAQAQAQQQQQS